MKYMTMSDEKIHYIIVEKYVLWSDKTTKMFKYYILRTTLYQSQTILIKHKNNY